MKKTLLFLALTTVFACSGTKKDISPTAILITDVHIVDVSDGNIREKMQVVIDSGMIKIISGSIANAGDYPVQIEGTGQYLIPGLAEMHAHIPEPPTTQQRIEETLFLYLSNGVTTIRGMLGHPSQLELRKRAADGSLISPRILVSSPSLNGRSASSKEQVIKLVNQYKKEGFDFLKIHPGVPLEAFDQIVETARELDIPFAGHVPVEVGIRHALESKYASIDHVDGYLEGLVPNSARVSPTDNGFFGYNFTPLADTSLIDDLVDLTRENQVWIVPTQSLFERWFAPIGSDELFQQPEMKYMPATTLANWRKSKEGMSGPNSNLDKEQWEQFIAIRQQLIRKLQDDGHGMLLGSDAPQVANVPGFSIHHEIQGMIRAGLTPLEILQSGTINPARYFGMEDIFGQVKEGLQADLILLQANPLEDMGALKSVSGVFVKGKWLSKKMIDEKLDEIARNAEGS